MMRCKICGPIWLLAIALLFHQVSSHPAPRSRVRRVVGGDALEMGAWPWLVSLNFLEHHQYLELQGLDHLCGGTLVGPQWVLTAAHCVHFASGSESLGQSHNWKAVLGEYNRRVNESTEQVIDVESIHVYPNYSLNPQLTKDIALLRLQRPANLTAAVSPINLDVDRELQPGSFCEAAGWGQHTSDQHDALQYGNGTLVPHVVTVKNVALETCAGAYNNLWPRIDENVLCFNSDNQKDTCKGDSGGPLVCRNSQGEAVVTGVVSVGMGCALEAYPGIYTRVSQFRDWILNTMRNYDTNHVIAEQLQPLLANPIAV